MNPTRSAKSTVVRRRSATGSVRAGWAREVGDGATAGPLSGAPHSAQNRPPAEGAPQAAHTRGAREAPHSTQNFAPPGASVPHWAQAAIGAP